MKKPTATEIPLQGVALIEASAGTGKTWTLTGIILRLIVEAEYFPEKIVATTFTRAAAAEMRRRIYARLYDFYQLLLALKDVKCEENWQRKREIFATGDWNAFSRDILYSLKKQIDLQELQKIANDKINHYLIDYLSEKEDKETSFLSAINRTKLAIDDIDRFFIGTLDSLCQRWLYEYALETGATDADINEESPVIRHLVHDFLRKFYQKRAISDPKLFSAFYQINKQDSEAYVPVVKSAITYHNVIIDPVDIKYRPLPNLSTFSQQEIDTAQQLLCQGKKEKYLNGNLTIVKQAEKFSSIFHHYINQKEISPIEKSFINGLLNFFINPKFNKNTPSSFQEKLLKNDTFIKFIEYINILEENKLRPQKFIADSILYTVRHGKNLLPNYLEERGETLYSELLAKLNRALENSPNSRLAKNITYHYPVILVDESQDLNREQAKMIEHLHLNMSKDHHGFLLLVGDPKQAIYRFRGSDVRNYQRLKNQIPKQNIYSLQENYRSSPQMIKAVNYLYEGDAKNAMGEGISYIEMSAAREEGNIFHNYQVIENPIVWIENNKADDEYSKLQEIIFTLLNHKNYQKKDSMGKLVPLEYKDILIITRNNDSARKFEEYLQKYAIPTARNSDISIFSGEMAQEISYLLQAILYPQKNVILRRLLAGKFFRLNYQSLKDLTESEVSKKIESLRENLENARDGWQKYGLLNALQNILLYADFSGYTIWEMIANQPAPKKYRDLLDLRQIQRIVAEYAPTMRPNTFLDWWQIQCKEKPKKDWAIIQPLSDENAIRLMTIHKSKGLQSPVVILAGLSKPSYHSKDKYSLKTYHDEKGNLHLNFEQGKDISDPKIQSLINREENEELSRQLYVALTRSEDLLFIFSRNSALDQLKQLNRKLDEENNHFNFPSKKVENIEKKQIFLPEPEAPPKQSGWGKTSFSALLRNLQGDLYDRAVYEDSAAELSGEQEEIIQKIDFRFQFARGTEAGSFLHETLEKIYPEQFLKRHPYHSKEFLLRLLHKYHLIEQGTIYSDKDLQSLQLWLDDILQTPLEGNTSLAVLNKKNCQKEMGFNLAITLRAFDNEKLKNINRLLKDWGKNIELPMIKYESRYLRGEIDLVYMKNGKFFVVDYKSNYLGDNQLAYTKEAMQGAMNQHCYWLQALIYQLALHRLLRVRLPDYDPNKHLGKPQYLFLRGISKEIPDNGHYSVDLPIKWVMELEKILLGN